MSRFTTIVALLLLAFAPAIAQSSSTPVFDWDEVVRPESPDPLRWPVGVAAASAAELAVADAYGSRLVIMAWNTAEWKQDRAIDLPATPYGIAHDGVRYLVSLRNGGGLVAVEGERHQLRKINLPAGAMPGAVAAVPGGGFLVHDQGSKQVLKLEASGTIGERWPVDGYVTGLASAPNGGFYASLARSGEIAVHGADGREALRIAVPSEAPVPAWPVGILREPDGNLLVIDRHASRILKLDVSGKLEGRGSRMGWDPGLLRFPSGLALLPDGRLAVADQGNGRVQLFRPVEGAAAP